ncbi:hypothetical protein QFZ96_002161 [Paraburkholderia youngii]
MRSWTILGYGPVPAKEAGGQNEHSCRPHNDTRMPDHSWTYTRHSKRQLKLAITHIFAAKPGNVAYVMFLA